MTQNKTEVMVGGLVLLAAVGFLAYAAQITGLSSSSSSYPLTASFRSLEGVNVVSGLNVQTLFSRSLLESRVLA